MTDVNQNNAGQPGAGISDVVVTEPQVDVSQGFPVPADNAVPPATDTPGTPQGDVEPPKAPEGTVDTPETPDNVTERLKQQNAQNAKLLSALGIDPLSDIAEQLEHGLITPDDVKRHVASKYQPQTAPETTAPVPENPVALAEAEQKAALAAYNKEVADTESVSIATNNRLRQADQTLSNAKLEQLTQQITADKEASNQEAYKRQVNESVDVVTNVARDFEEFANMDAPKQQSVEQITLAHAGYLAGIWAKQNGVNPATLTVNHYRHFANEAAKQLGSLGEHYRNLGRREAKPGFVPNNLVPPNVNVNNNNMPTPANSSGAPIPVNNPYVGTDVSSHKDAARKYMSGSGRVV